MKTANFIEIEFYTDGDFNIEIDGIDYYKLDEDKYLGEYEPIMIEVGDNLDEALLKTINLLNSITISRYKFDLKDVIYKDIVEAIEYLYKIDDLNDIDFYRDYGNQQFTIKPTMRVII